MNSTSRLNIIILSVFLLISNPVSAISYKDIANSYLASFDVVLDKANDSTKQKNDDKQDDKKKKKLKFDVPQMTEHQCCEKTFNLLSQCKDNKNFDEVGASDTMKRNVSKDLEILCGNGKKSASLMSQIDRTQTSFGRAALAKMVSEPLTDVDALRARQEVVRQLVDDEELFSELEHALETANRSESNLFSFWNEAEKPLQEAIDKLYFGKWFGLFNKNQYLLEGKTRFGNLGTVFDGTSDFLAVIGIHCFADRFFAKSDDYSVVKSTKWLGGIVFNSLNPKGYQRYYQDLGMQYDKSIQKIQMNDDMNQEETEQVVKIFSKFKKGRIAFVGMKAALVGYLSYLEYRKISNATEKAISRRDTANYLQTKLVGVADIVDTLSVINKTLSRGHLPCDGLNNSEAITKLFDKNFDASLELKSLILALQTNTFVDKASFFSLTGRVLSAYKKMEEVKDQLIPAMEALGELDACMSIARLYKEYAGQDVTYSFVKYIDNNEPYIALQDFWNPFIDVDQIVTNSVELGGGASDRNMILTGSNTGGKSTALKAVSMNMLLAHTIGIAPAKKVVVTPMAFIGTSLNISDDTASGVSLFKAEVLRARTLKEVAESLSGDKFAFFAIDELFTGTNAVSGSQAAYEFIKELAQNNNLVFIMATHFPQVTELENEISDLCTNYKMDVIKHDNGDIEHTFKLKLGISDTNIAFDLINDQFDLTGAQA